MNLLVERASSPLAREQWRFWVDIDRGMVRVILDSHRRLTRATARHKWIASAASYDRLHSGPIAPRVSIPDDVVEEARRKVVESIEIVR